MKNKNNNTTLPFILVSDLVLAERMKKNGFVCINETESMCTFINNGKLIFEGSLDEHNILYSNKLCI